MHISIKTVEVKPLTLVIFTLICIYIVGGVFTGKIIRAEKNKVFSQYENLITDQVKSLGECRLDYIELTNRYTSFVEDRTKEVSAKLKLLD